VVQLAGELFAEKGYRATTVREIADAAGILSGSLYHHFDSKESIGDEILSGFINDVLADERTWVIQLERGKEQGAFRADLDARLTYRLLRDVLWIPSQWRLAEGYSTEQVAETLLRLLFDGITARG